MIGAVVRPPALSVRVVSGQAKLSAVAICHRAGFAWNCPTVVMVPAPDAAVRIDGGILIGLGKVGRVAVVVGCETTAPGATGTRSRGNVGPVAGTFCPN